MLEYVAVDIEHEDVLGLDRRLVGAGAWAEQHAIGAGHAHRHVAEDPNRPLQIEHPGQDRRLAAERCFVVHEAGSPTVSSPRKRGSIFQNRWLWAPAFAGATASWRHLPGNHDDRQPWRKPTSCGEAI